MGKVMINDSEKRVYPRKRFKKTVECDCIVKQLNKLEVKKFRGLCIDISEGGIGMMTNVGVSKGQVLEIRIPVNTEDVKISAFAEVIWSRPINGKYKAGLRFLR